MNGLCAGCCTYRCCVDCREEPALLRLLLLLLLLLLWKPAQQP